MIQKLRLLLLPFSLIYGAVAAVRNLFFDWGWYHQTSFKAPVIALGNLTVGGTGKTPHADYLIKLLLPQYRVGLVSRGYRRKTKGVVVANEHSTASDIGDEPMQLLRKYQYLTVVVSEKRVPGIQACLEHQSKPQLIVLDDAYQHRYVKPGLSILLIDYKRPVWTDFVLPAGNLREFKCGKKRADIVVITKCPETLNVQEASEVKLRFRLKGNQTIYYTSMKYGKLYPLFSKDNEAQIPEIRSNDVVFALSAIASPQPFLNYLRTLTDHVAAINYPDHYSFTIKDMQHLALRFNEHTGFRKWIVTTEKDAVKLLEMNDLPSEIKSFSLVLPIEPFFLFQQSISFNHQIEDYVRESESNE